MLKVGLTGGFATGKSTVAEWLGELGCYLIRYDPLGHRVLEPNGAAYQPVIEAFGTAILNPDRTINRSALAKIVFPDPEALERLSSIVHPPAHALAAAEIDRWRAADPHGIVVVEAAILIETGTYRNYDCLIVVTCQPAQQMERGLARGLDRSQIEERLSRQIALEEKATYADYLIDTSGSIAESRRQTEAVYKQLVERERAGRR